LITHRNTPYLSLAADMSQATLWALTEPIPPQ
jgi:hypothetical protein